MIHPSYSEINEVICGYSEGEKPTVSSRYSVCIATAKRARQLIDGAEPLASSKVNKPLSTAVEEIYESKVKVLGNEDPTAVELEEVAAEDMDTTEE